MKSTLTRKEYECVHVAQTMEQWELRSDRSDESDLKAFDSAELCLAEEYQERHSKSI